MNERPNCDRNMLVCPYASWADKHIIELQGLLSNTVDRANEIDNLRTRVADQTNELFTAHDAITRLRARMAELEARVIAECGHVDLLAGRAIKLEARVAELELELKPLADAADKEAQLQRHKSRDATSGIARERKRRIIVRPADEVGLSWMAPKSSAPA